ncbi:lysophospholipid acyltransferase family protein [Candidatus Laterigemmans baculatus]|uniref:lysophospholipid acyltransferase family protein n=1 Tax=Candidatus Laterigemmans baculatus TaxID=2770505 RepID=UPI0013DC5ED1|nr:lysophospholipid acyltransferase family protein [Candidatus Laterigemmans baculatus]
MQPLIDFAAYLIVRLFIAVVQVMPEDRADAMCHQLARLLSGPVSIRRATIERNLTRVFPEATEAERAALRRAMWHHLMLMICEIAWAPRRLHRCNWKEHVDFPNAPAFLSRLLSRRPTVLVTGHFGNFEIGGYVTGLMGLSTTTIARRLDNAYLHDFVAEFRGAKGQRMVDKEGCASEVDRHLAAGGTLSLLADQHAGTKGCWVEFLGHPASCHKALALFTLSGDAPMAVAYTIRNQRPMQFTMGCTGVADPREPGEECKGVRQLTRWYNDRLAEAIRLAPEQYWWMHNRWRDPPAKQAKRLAA